MGKFWGQEGSREHIFFTWLNEPVGLEGQGLHLGKFPRTSPEGLEKGRRELAGQAQGGAGTGGPWRVGRGRTEPRAQARAQPVSPPSWLRAVAQRLFCQRRWAGRRSSPLTDPPQHYTRGLGASSHPVSHSGAGTPPDVSPSLLDICFLTLSATPQKSPILLHPGPQPAQDKTFVPSGHPRNPFSGCDPTTPFPCI